MNNKHSLQLGYEKTIKINRTFFKQPLVHSKRLFYVVLLLI